MEPRGDASPKLWQVAASLAEPPGDRKHRSLERPRIRGTLHDRSRAHCERYRQIQAQPVAQPIDDVEVDEVHRSDGWNAGRSRRIVALISHVEVVCVGVLIRNLSLPLLGREERIVLDTQTGRRKSNRLSALARGGPRKAENRHQNQEADEPTRGTGAATCR